MRYLLPIGIAAVAAFDLLCVWLRSFDVDYNEGDELPDGLIVWGTCRSLHRRDPIDFRYLIVRFPFISQWLPDYGRKYGGYSWHYPVLLRFAGKWRWHWQAVRQPISY